MDVGTTGTTRGLGQDGWRKKRQRGRDRRETGGGEGDKNREETVRGEGRLEEIGKRTGGKEEGRGEDRGRGRRNKLGI